MRSASLPLAYDGHASSTDNSTNTYFNDDGFDEDSEITESNDGFDDDIEATECDGRE